MKAEDCKIYIEKHLNGSPCGTVFKYCNDEYQGNKPHLKIVVAHDKKLDCLCVISATSQSLSAFRYAPDIDDIHVLSPDEYQELTQETYFIVSAVEIVSIDELIEKCVRRDEFIEYPSNVDSGVIREMQQKAVDSIHTKKAHRKMIRKCLIIEE